MVFTPRPAPPIDWDRFQRDVERKARELEKYRQKMNRGQGHDMDSRENQMDKYLCGMRGMSDILDHDHSSFSEWQACKHPKYSGVNAEAKKASTMVKDRPKKKVTDELYTGAPSEFDVALVEADEKVNDNVKALESSETAEQRQERQAAEKAAREVAKKQEQETYVRGLKAKRAPLSTELAGLREDQKTAMKGWFPIGLTGVVSIASLVGAGLLSAIPGGIFTGLVVLGFILGGILFLVTGGFVVYWIERFYSGRPVSSQIASIENKIAALDEEINKYTPMPESVWLF